MEIYRPMLVVLDPKNGIREYEEPPEANETEDYVKPEKRIAFSLGPLKVVCGQKCRSRSAAQRDVEVLEQRVTEHMGTLLHEHIQKRNTRA